MEIIGTNISDKNQNNKKMMKIIIILIILLLIISISLGVAIYFLKLQQFKFVVDGSSIAKSDGIFIINEDKMKIMLDKRRIW